MTSVIYANNRRKWTIAVFIVAILVIVILVIAGILYFQESSKKDSTETQATQVELVFPEKTRFLSWNS
eukprot:g18933.t1